jgi:two-component system nitrogen regulation response regulator NtrX
VVVYTGTGSYDRCVQALRLGAYGFIDKAESVERVVQEVESALERLRLLAEVESLKRDLGTDSPLIGSSPALQNLREEIARIAPVPSPVLIVGESGSGKELVARELHRLGSDPKKSFVAINSAALPENLVESELFGHERGAFTGASRTRKGAFEVAAGGTLFLDEIGELPMPAQAKLLRVLEENQITRLGGERSIKIDTRVVAATNRDLDQEVEASRFRRDLYYRVNVHVISVPPLRDHLSDIPELIDHFLTVTCARFGVRKKKLDPGALEILMSYRWEQNNVRELRNIVERMIIATSGDLIGIESSKQRRNARSFSPHSSATTGTSLTRRKTSGSPTTPASSRSCDATTSSGTEGVCGRTHARSRRRVQQNTICHPLSLAPGDSPL